MSDVRGEQLKDLTLTEEQHADDSVVDRMLADSAKVSTLSYKGVATYTGFSFNPVSTAQSYLFPLVVDFVTDANSGTDPRAYVQVAPLLNTTSYCSLDGETDRLILTPWTFINTNLLASTLGPGGGGVWEAEITFISAGNAGSFNLTYNTDGSLKLGTGSDVAIAGAGYYVLEDANPNAYIVVKITVPGGGSHPGSPEVINNPLLSENRFGVFTNAFVPTELAAGSYTGVYPAALSLWNVPPESFLSTSSGTVPISVTALPYDEDMGVGGTVTNGNPIGTISGIPNLPGGVSNSEARKYIELYVNGAKQYFTRYSYDVGTKQLTWDYTGFDLTPLDDIVVRYMKSI
jgi:hypothetical protein